MKDDFFRYASVSGGKDSAAVYLWCIDQFGPSGFKAVMADTGNEHPVTLNYVRNLHQMTGGPVVEIVKADFADRLELKGILPDGNPFLDMMLWKGRAPSTKAQFCTEHLKMAPIRKWVIENRGDLPSVGYVGLRKAESAKRALRQREEINEFMDSLAIHPIIEWAESDVFDFLKAKGIPPNPLYIEGFSRVGCFPCIHARKREVGQLPDWVWERLEYWESRIGGSWFPSGILPGTRGTKKIPKLEEVRAWSKTLRGGKEIDESVDEKDPPSCMVSWGHCE